MGMAHAVPGAWRMPCYLAWGIGGCANRDADMGGPRAGTHMRARGVSSRVRAASGDRRVKMQAWTAALRYIWQRLLARTVPLAAPSHARVFHSKRTIISQCPSDVS